MSDSNTRSRKTRDLQSPPVGHFGNSPLVTIIQDFYLEVNNYQYLTRKNFMKITLKELRQIIRETTKEILLESNDGVEYIKKQIIGDYETTQPYEDFKYIFKNRLREYVDPAKLVAAVDPAKLVEAVDPEKLVEAVDRRKAIKALEYIIRMNYWSELDDPELVIDSIKIDIEDLLKDLLSSKK